MVNEARIDQINVYLPMWRVRDGKYQQFAVETKLNENDDWSECWSVDHISAPPNNVEKNLKYVVNCR